MDRYQFVEKLLSEKKDLLAKKDDLTAKKEQAYSRSITRFREMLKPKENEHYGAAIGFGSLGHASVNFPEESKVTDNDIKNLCHEIKSLEKECDELENEIEILGREDFVNEILKFITKD